jgi:hypothetical protein
LKENKYFKRSHNSLLHSSILKKFQFPPLSLTPRTLKNWFPPMILDLPRFYSLHISFLFEADVAECSKKFKFYLKYQKRSLKNKYWQNEPTATGSYR